jgi:hypothetical protein
MVIIRPRLNDFYNLPFRQEDVDFVIPFLDEDIPFYIDPFLLWKSPSMQDNAQPKSGETFLIDIPIKSQGDV